MTDTRRIDILQSPLFILSLAILLLNDWYLKYELNNWLTGKLSDFSGLIVVFLLAFAFYPSRPKSLLLILASCFVYWKSPASQPLIEVWNRLDIMTIDRIVDYTDLLALPAPVLAWLMVRNRHSSSPGKISRTIIILCSVFAITGTSQVTMTKEEKELLEKIEKIRQERVSTYTYYRHDLADKRLYRLESLLSTIPDPDKLEKRLVKFENYRKDNFEAITYGFNGFYINTWIFHNDPNRLTEYYILPINQCDRQLALGKTDNVVAFRSAYFRFYRVNNGTELESVKLVLCDIPTKRNKTDALDYLLNNYISRIEEKFY